MTWPRPSLSSSMRYARGRGGPFEREPRARATRVRDHPPVGSLQAPRPLVLKLQRAPLPIHRHDHRDGNGAPASLPLAAAVPNLGLDMLRDVRVSTVVPRMIDGARRATSSSFSGVLSRSAEPSSAEDTRATMARALRELESLRERGLPVALVGMQARDFPRPKPRARALPPRLTETRAPPPRARCCSPLPRRYCYLPPSSCLRPRTARRASTKACFLRDALTGTHSCNARARGTRAGTLSSARARQRFARGQARDSCSRPSTPPPGRQVGVCRGALVHAHARRRRRSLWVAAGL